MIASWIRNLVSARVLKSYSRKPFARERASSCDTTDALESRQMLAAVIATPGTTNYTLDDGDTLIVNGDFDEDLNVTFNGAGVVAVRDGADLGNARFTSSPTGTLGRTRVVFNNGSSADQITVVGAGGNDQLLALRGSDLGDIVFDATNDQGLETARSLVRIDNGATTQDITYLGSRGVDRLVVAGNVASGQITADLGAGNDAVVFRNSATVQAPVRPDLFNAPAGVVSIQTDAGNDFVRFQGGRFDNFDLSTGENNDLVIISGSSPSTTFAGAVELNLDNGHDRLFIDGVTDVTLGLDINAGAGDDRVSVKNLTGGNPLTEDPVNIDLGSSGAGRDRLTFGGMNYTGAVNVTWQGRVSIGESARNVFSTADGANATVHSLNLSGGTIFSTAMVWLNKGSQVDGGLFYESPGQTNFTTNVSVTGALGTRIVTGQQNDRIVLRGGVHTTAFISADRGDDVVQISGGTQLANTSAVLTGLGVDTVRLLGASVGEGTGGDINIDSTGDEAGLSRVVLGNLNVGGSVNVSYSGATFVREVAAVNAGGSLRLSEFSNTALTGLSPLTYQGHVGSSYGAAVITAMSSANIRIAGTMRNFVNISTGDGNDVVNLQGANVGGPSEINTGDGADLVDLTDAVFGDSEFAARLNVLLGDGDDTLLNTGTLYDALSELDGGDGVDSVSDPANGVTVNFE